MASLAGVGAVLPAGRFSAAVHFHERVDSTNRVARDLGRAGAPDGALVIADEQTHGRGRRQRRWVSPAGAGLYASFVLRPGFPAAESGSAVQLAAGIAVAEAVAPFLAPGAGARGRGRGAGGLRQPGVEATAAIGGVSPALVGPVLRWPNDVYVGERKIAGVLVEAETTGRGFDFLVCGIGVNVNHEASDFPDQLRDHATSLKLRVGHRVDRGEVLAALVAAFDTWEGVWRAHGLAPIVERWLELSPETVAGEVSVQTESGRVEGRTAGLSAAGHLRVHTAEGLLEVSVGEVVRLRPS